MAKIIWIGGAFFAHHLNQLGHELVHLDCKPGEIFSWDRLCTDSGIKNPDLIVVGDKSYPPFVVGMEHFPCLTVFYAIDSHIHSWYPRYAQGFDFCLVSMKDHIPLFLNQQLTVEQVLWSPTYCPFPPLAKESCSLPYKEWDLLFVGTVDEKRNPARYSFMQELGKAFPGLYHCSGSYVDLFPKGRLILNHSIAGDLNFRTFEALGMGTCLLNPAIGNGLNDFFKDQEDLFLFDQNNIPALVRLIQQLLTQPERCSQVAASGLEKIRNSHQPQHRAHLFAKKILSLVNNNKGQTLIKKRLQDAAAIHSKYLRLIYLLLADNIEFPQLQKAYLDAAQKNS